MSVRLPNLVIAGVTKAATTSLFRYLGQHPDVSPADHKELRYFTPIRHGEPLASIETYVSHFPRWTSERYAMEATPGYFYGGRALAERMDATLPEARVIVSLRAPADRCWSYYRFMKSRLRVPKDLDFDTYLDQCEDLRRRGVDGTREHQPHWGLGGGCYSTWLEEWAGVFGDRLRIVFFDDIIKRPADTVADLCGWLDLDPASLADLSYAVDNKSEQYRNAWLQRSALRVNRRQEMFFADHPSIKRTLRRTYHLVNRDASVESPSAASRVRLDEFYRPYNDALSRQLAVIGCEGLPPWLGSAAR